MSIDVEIKECETLPHPTDWYAKVPFDPSVTFRDAAGNNLRYMLTPLDEKYANEVGVAYVDGSIPPEEREIRDHLVAAVLLRSMVSSCDFWWSQFFGSTKKYKASSEALSRLNKLCNQSKEHRAAFCRLSNSETVSDGLRIELKKIVAMCDARK